VKGNPHEEEDDNESIVVYSKELVRPYESDSYVSMLPPPLPYALGSVTGSLLSSMGSLNLPTHEELGNPLTPTKNDYGPRTTTPKERYGDSRSLLRAGNSETVAEQMIALNYEKVDKSTSLLKENDMNRITESTVGSAMSPKAQSGKQRTLMGTTSSSAATTDKRALYDDLLKAKFKVIPRK
jgi:hypothetical protein